MSESLRERVAMVIHTATTQVPGKTPHECDYDAADAVLDILHPSGNFHSLKLFRAFVKDVAEAAIYDTSDAGQCISVRYQEQAQELFDAETSAGDRERHYHVSGDHLDVCAKCGLDLRDSIHLREGETK